VFGGLGFRGSDKTTHYRDSSPYGNHGTLTGMDAATDWQYDNTIQRPCVDFTPNEYITLGTKATLKPTLQITYACWANVDTAYSGQVGLIGDLGASGDRGAWMAISTSDPYSSTMTAYVAINATTLYSVTTATITTSTMLNAWAHYAMTFSPTLGLSIFMNGVLVGSNAVSPPSSIYANGLPVIIGSRGDLSGYFMLGKIADPTLHNRALSLPEIQQLADPSNVMLSGLILPPRRKWWAVPSGTPATFKSYWANQATQVAM
jgi:hypothetical protein